MEKKINAHGYLVTTVVLAVPNSDLRLFGKPEGFVKRRMGVALSFAESIDLARSRAKEVANAVKVIAE